jgi:hypothetical protein
MGNRIEKQLLKTLRRQREQLVKICQDIEDLLDYLKVLEARSMDEKKPRLTHADVMERFNCN